MRTEDLWFFIDNDNKERKLDWDALRVHIEAVNRDEFEFVELELPDSGYMSAQMEIFSGVPVRRIKAYDGLKNWVVERVDVLAKKRPIPR